MQIWDMCKYLTVHLFGKSIIETLKTSTKFTKEIKLKEKSTGIKQQLTTE